MAQRAMSFRSSSIEEHAATGTTMSRRNFNLVTGLLLLGGFAFMGLTSWLVLQPAFAPMFAAHALPIGIGGLVLSILGMILIIAGERRQSVVLLGAGYAAFTLSFGATTSLILPHYGIDTVVDAFFATGAICSLFALLGVLFPKAFEKLVVVAMVALLGTIIASIIMAFMGVAPTWIDYVTVGVFAIFIGYDVHRATVIEPNMYNAVLVAANIFIDIINVFFSLLEIFDRD